MKDEMIRTLLIDPDNPEAPPLKSEIDRQVYELSNPTHPISNAMTKMRDIPAIRIIEGLDT